MNKLEEINKRLAYFPRELQDGGFSDNSLTFCARLDIEYLLSIVEQAEKVLQQILEDVGHTESHDIKMIAEEALQAIRK